MSIMDWKSEFVDRIVSAQEAVRCIKSGDRVVIGHACGEPCTLVDAMVERAPELENVEINHMVAMGSAKYCQPGMEKSFHHNAFFLGPSTRKASNEGRVGFIPGSLFDVGKYFSDGYLPVDVTLIQVSPPDENGQCSFGISVDFTEPAARVAKTVIAQINNNMPRTYGSSIALSDIDWIVLEDAPILELQPPTIGQVEEAIGRNIAALIPDGATIQLGIGAIPAAVLNFLKDKKDLGIHTEMFSDGVVELAKAGVINNRKKTLHPGKFVATFLMGTKKLYDFVDNNPNVLMCPATFTNDPFIISQNDLMICINSAIQIDLMGQVNGEMIGPKQFSGSGGQVDFIRGAWRSKGGKSIIAFPSTASKGTKSRIVFRLDEGSAVTTLRSDIHYVVTEYGVAQLRGKTLKQRAKALIDIAHPDFRDKLEIEMKNI